MSLPESNALRPSVVFLGMTGVFSLLPMLALMQAGIRVQAVMVPGNREQIRLGRPVVEPLLPPTPVDESSIPLVSSFLQKTIITFAWEQAIPVFQINRPSAPEFGELLQSLAPDAACTACFSRRIPASALTIPHWGFLNVHPSLLPDYRGPAPLFWAFRDGLAKTGVTVHRMDADWDTGDVMAQGPLLLPEGVSGPEADRLAGGLGGGLLVDVINRLQTGEFEGAPQMGGFNKPWPGRADFELNRLWPAKRAFNFMRGTEEWDIAYGVDLGIVWAHLATALDYDPTASLENVFTEKNGQIKIQFAPGVLTATLESNKKPAAKRRVT